MNKFTVTYDVVTPESADNECDYQPGYRVERQHWQACTVEYLDPYGNWSDRFSSAEWYSDRPIALRAAARAYAGQDYAMRVTHWTGHPRRLIVDGTWEYDTICPLELSALTKGSHNV